MSDSLKTPEAISDRWLLLWSGFRPEPSTRKVCGMLRAMPVRNGTRDLSRDVAYVVVSEFAPPSVDLQVFAMLMDKESRKTQLGLEVLLWLIEKSERLAVKYKLPFGCVPVDTEGVINRKLLSRQLRRYEEFRA